MLVNKTKINKNGYALFVFLNYISKVLYPFLNNIKVNYYKNNINFYIRNSNDIFKILYFFKKHTQSQFIVLSDIFGIDKMTKTGRFQVVYALLSIRYNTRIRLNLFVDESTQIKSATSLYKSAGWLEREVWDMFGVYFKDSNDLRRILTDYGFDGFPLRKDFPLSGFIELRYDDSLKRVVYEPIEVSQEFRFFDFKSPWEQIENLY